VANILVVANGFPTFDRQTGALRFYQILKILARRHRIYFYAAEIEDQRNAYGSDEVDRYKKALVDLGIEVNVGAPGEGARLLRTQSFDAVFFEYYSTLLFRYIDIDEIRFFQPGAIVMVDTVDVEYHRLLTRAKLTKNPADFEFALSRKSAELGAYQSADLVITTSNDDKALLQSSGLQRPIEVIALIHPIVEFKEKGNFKECRLMFVGNFELDANVDAMLYFTNKVLPLIQRTIPNVRLRIVGNAPPEEIRRLAGDTVEVLGFVPSLTAAYKSSSVAIVPVRWGGGLKGKIVEAMSFGLPVVTTSVGAEGFGLSPGTNILIGDDPESFAAATISLLRNQDLYEQIRRDAWKFAHDNYSEQVISQKINHVFDNLARYSVGSLSVLARLRRQASLMMDRHVLWRLRGSPSN